MAPHFNFMTPESQSRSNFLMFSAQVILSACCLIFATHVVMAQETPDSVIAVTLRKEVSADPSSSKFKKVNLRETWEAKKTAIIVCDMWDLHHCKNSVIRVKEMAPRMNQVIAKARSKGVLIIHAPSSCMDFYKDHPARRNAQQAPKAKNLPKDIHKCSKKIPSEDQGKYPIDQTDGGEDDEPDEHRLWAEKLEKMGRNPRAPWKRQIDVIEIATADAISDSGVEIWNLLEKHEIDNVILVGVHTNMCVLGRPFGLRQMVKNGKNVALMRDMTDTMYNPKRWPYVNHYRGTDLIVDHIEKFVCPTLTSDQILGDVPFVFTQDPDRSSGPSLKKVDSPSRN